jgi:hypothetical protein
MFEILQDFSEKNFPHGIKEALSTHRFEPLSLVRRVRVLAVQIPRLVARERPFEMVD